MAQMNAKDALNLAKTYHKKGEIAQAEQVYSALLQVDPHNSEAMHNLGGLIFASRGDLDSAIATMKQAIVLDRNNPEFHNNIGELYRKAGQLEHAKFHLSSAVELRPQYGEAYSNLGLVYRQLGDIDNSKLCFANALEINPRNTAALINSGNLMREEENFSDAVECYQAALAISPDNPTALKTVSMAYSQLGGDYNSAAKYLSRLTTGHPDLHAEKVDLALICLRNKDFRKGFQLLESRLKYNDIMKGDIDTLWRGGTGQDEKILYVYNEDFIFDSIGDTIMFARYVRELERFSPFKVVFKVQSELVELLSENMPSFVQVTDEDCHAFDKHSPLFSLGLVMNARAKTIPNTEGYIRADGSAPADSMQSDRIKVGIAGIDDDSALTGNDKVQLYNIDEHATIKEKASAIANIDMLITTDNDTVHLAGGAMGKKTALIIDEKHDWRWFNAKNGKTSEWYAVLLFT